MSSTMSPTADIERVALIRQRAAVIGLILADCDIAVELDLSARGVLFAARREAEEGV